MILWVDDNEELRSGAAERLEAAGYRILEAASAEEAQGIADQPGTELILLLTDLRLPGADGLELAAGLRRRDPRLPVLLVTSYAPPERLEAWQGEERFRWLPKPFDGDKLLELVAELVGEPRRSEDAAPSPESPAPAPDRPSTSQGPATPAPSPGLASEPVRPAAGPGRSKRLLPRLLPAVAAGLALAVVFGYLATPAPPPLPDPETSNAVRRGGGVRSLEPYGPIAALPESFRWRETEGAERYAVEVTTVDRGVLWRGETATSHLELSGELSGQLRPLAAYYWRVEAFDAAGELIATSERTRFRIVEPAE